MCCQKSQCRVLRIQVRRAGHPGLEKQSLAVRNIFNPINSPFNETINDPMESVQSKISFDGIHNPIHFALNLL